MGAKRALVIINNKSTRAETDLAPAMETFERERIEVHVEESGDPTKLANLITACDDGFDLIVVGGGDGTMAAVGMALHERGLPVGMLPLGNACDLARSLGIPRDPAGAAEIVVSGHTRAIDLGIVNGCSFFNLASMGLSVQVARRLTRAAKRRWGVFSYPMLFWDAYRATRPFKADVVCDGSVTNLRTIQLGIGCGYYYGGGMTVSQDARSDDGSLHVYAIKPVSWMQLIFLFPRLWMGRLRLVEDVEIMKGSTVEVTTSSPRSINADGEIVTQTPAVFDIMAGAVQFFVRREDDPPGLSP